MLQTRIAPGRSKKQHAQFAMGRIKFGIPETEPEPISAPPHTLFEDNESYNILFNMYGIPESKIKIALDQEKSRLTIFAEREERDFTDQFLWLFTLPRDATLRDVETHYKCGIVQFRFPRLCPLRAPVGGAAC